MGPTFQEEKLEGAVAVDTKWAVPYAIFSFELEEFLNR